MPERARPVNLVSEFEVNAPIADVWSTLTDVERIAPCFPGAKLQEAEGNEYRGVVKVKLGPIVVELKGAARITEQDDDAYRVVIEGAGTGRQGQASAVVVVKADPVGDRTKVNVVTDVSLSGRIAQFGRSGIMIEVSEKIVSQFAENLSLLLNAGGSRHEKLSVVTAGATGAASAQVAGVRKINAPEPEALDLVNATDGLLAKWFAPVAFAVTSIAAGFRLVRRRAK
jgi:carbon monoxide dehydrogenase subunit G